MKKYYVYEWFNVETNEVFYVGKGSGNRHKDMRNRNKLFVEYCSKNIVDVRITNFFEDENDAFQEEEQKIKEYQKNGQCFCNMYSGGYGGFSSVWTEQAKEYWSNNNPMKAKEQRDRMSKNNPMYNKEYALKNGAKHKKSITIDQTCYPGIVDAVREFKVDESTIIRWLKNGYTSTGKMCYYTQKGMPNHPYTPPKNNKKPIIIDEQYFSSCAEGANFLNITQQQMNNILKHNKIYKGHNCKYANQQPS